MATKSQMSDAGRKRLLMDNDIDNAMYPEGEYPSVPQSHKTLQDLIDASSNVNAEMVTNPQHYHLEGLGIDAMEIIREVLGEEGWKAYCKGNMLKYLLRKKWDADEDVAKSGRYADMYRGIDLRGK